jgi:peptide chain release factor subunit 1
MFARTELDRLLHFRSAEAPVVSLYVTFPKEQGLRGMKAHLHSMLKPVQDLADSDELSHASRLSLRADIERIHEIAKPLDLASIGDDKELDELKKRGRTEQLPEQRKELLGRTLAIFACHQAGLYEQRELDHPLPDRVELDATPYLRPLVDAMGQAHDAVVAIADAKNAWLFTYADGDVREAGKLHESLLDKRKRAAWHGEDEHSMWNREETWARKHLKETAKRIEELLQHSGAGAVVVGGHEETMPEFVALLSKPVQAKLAGQFAIDTATMTPAVIASHTRSVLEAHEGAQKRLLVDEILERVASGGFAAAGLEWCLLAVNEKAVEVLLVQTDARVPGRTCDNCGWLGLTEVECPVCSSQTRVAVDVLDEMETAVIDAGGRVSNIEPGTPLDAHTVAARLRFPVQKPAETERSER